MTTLIEIGRHSGYLFYAEGCLRPRHGGKPQIVFVPKEMIVRGKLDRRAYTLAFWPERNCGANAHAHGSHLWPDLCQPLSAKENSRKYVAEFIRQIEWRSS